MRFLGKKIARRKLVGLSGRGRKESVEAEFVGGSGDLVAIDIADEVAFGDDLGEDDHRAGKPSADHLGVGFAAVTVVTGDVDHLSARLQCPELGRA